MSHRRYELMEYKNQQLMDELNEFMINCKVHLFDLPLRKPKPSSEEMDNLMNRIMEVLKQDAIPMKRY